ncbi:hypothetical protein MNV49_005016 [Pseudohyphozyma bogoriensis]|nr:hypothetical protein MNV49_005016 [Pseudohyphozyma bogoriensis]
MSTQITQNSRAYILALAAYMGIFLFGYDSGVAGGLSTLPSFMKAFGYYNKNAHEQAQIESWVVSILMLGAFAGALGASPFAQGFGRKWSLMGFTLVFSIGAAVQTAASTSGQMYAGRFIAGLGVGGMSNVSETSPKEVRGRITGMFQVIVVIGVAVSYWIEYGLTAGKANTFQWRFPLAFQLVPAGLMLVILPFIRESPRWSVYKGRHEEALANLAWIRKREPTDSAVVQELAEITAALQEEIDATSGSSWKEIYQKGNRLRFAIAFFMFFLQQWSGQNSISYYAPTIFKSIGIRGTRAGLFASGIYGIVKIVATGFFIAFGIEKVGRRKALGFGGAAMSMFLWIIGSVFYTHVPDPNAENASHASIAMAAMIYCFVIPYCFSWGPVPWVYCSEIFPMRIRHYGMSTASSTQWIFNFCISKITPTLVLNLPNGRLFFLFAGLNIASSIFGFLLPETAGVSLEDMDILFGAVKKEDREQHIAAEINNLKGTEEFIEKTSTGTPATRENV